MCGEGKKSDGLRTRTCQRAVWWALWRTTATVKVKVKVKIKVLVVLSIRVTIMTCAVSVVVSGVRDLDAWRGGTSAVSMPVAPA